MSTSKKRLDTTIVNLTARIETSPEARANGSDSPSRTTTEQTKESSGTPTRANTKSPNLASDGAIHSPVTSHNKHTKSSSGTPSRTQIQISAGDDGSNSPRTTPSKRSKTSTGTPSRIKDKVKPCEKGQDLYNRICKGLIDSSRTPSKNNYKAITPSKFFKSRTPAALDQVIKSVSVSICDEPQDYITDVTNLKRRRSKNTRLVTVETVMPLYNIETGIDGHDDVEIVADIVEEVVKMSISGHDVSKKRSARNTSIRSKSKTERVVQESLKNDLSSLQVEENEEGKPVLEAVKPRKRKGSTQESQPLKKRNKVIYNSADSSDDDDAMFISTMRPILSEDDKKEMDEVLGVCNASDKSVNETEYEASKEIIEGKKRKEGAQ